MTQTLRLVLFGCCITGCFGQAAASPRAAGEGAPSPSLAVTDSTTVVLSKFYSSRSYRKLVGPLG